MNKIELAKAIATRLGDLMVDGTVDGATANTLQDIELLFPVDDQCKGFGLYIHTSALAADQDKIVSAFTAASHSLTVVPTFGVTPTIGDLYYLFERFRWRDYSEAINDAMRAARRVSLLPYTATMNIVGTQDAYPIPSGFDSINQLVVIPSGASNYDLDNWRDIPRQCWDIHKDAVGTYNLYFDPRFIELSNYDGRPAMVIGQRKPVLLSTPTTNAEVDDDFLVNFALADLALRRVGEGEEWYRKSYQYLLRARELERLIFTYQYPDSIGVAYV